MVEIVLERLQRPPIAQQRVEIASLVTLSALEGAKRLLILRLRTINLDLVVKALAERGYPQVVTEFVC